MKLTEGEEKSVLNMTEFLSLRFQDCYKQFFWKKPTFRPTDHLNKYDAFSQGPSFKPKDYLVDGFRPGSTAIFEHPKKLYSEYRATAKESTERRRKMIQQLSRFFASGISPHSAWN